MSSGSKAQDKASPRLVIVMRSRMQKHGSFEDFMICTAQKAAQKGWKVCFICPAIETPEVKRAIEAAGASFAEVQGDWNSLSPSLAMIRAILRARPDLVNFHFCSAGWFLLVYIACWLKRIKTVWHYHGEIRPLDSLSGIKKHLSSLRILSFFVTRIATVSEANKTFLRVLRVSKPIDVIYNGIDVPRFLSSACVAGKGRSSKVRLIYIGSLTTRKRVDVLLKAFALLRSRRSNIGLNGLGSTNVGLTNVGLADVALTIVGGGPEVGKLHRLASELAMGDCVTFTGLLPEYPFQLLAESDIFVSASEAESFGLVFVEAMCLGLPVVACAVGGVPEVVAHGETGVLVPSGNAEAVASAMEALVADASLRQKMGEAGRARARERFNLPDKVDSLISLFDSFRPQHGREELVCVGGESAGHNL
jgi:glycosyltransferase involved in cell wall biosynthesis